MTGSSGAAHPAVTETHISTLFFYGDRVFKVRKPVRYGFVGFTDPARRRADCEREVVLNRRLAPDVYLGTADVLLDGQPIEHAVVMRRLPPERSLEALVRRGAPVGDELRHVAETLAGFHRRAARSPAIDAAATATALWQRWQSTEEELSRFIGTKVDAAGYRELTTLAGRYLQGRQPLFASRIAARGACDGHGDLQAADVFCLDDGPRILDCLEFDDELRYGDVVADVAFLAADLEALGSPEAAGELVDHYEAAAPTGAPPSLPDFYIAARAHVRLLVECLRAEQGLDQRQPPSALLALALDHLRRAVPHLVLVGGAPGSGKSTVAGWLADRLDAELLSTDHIRRTIGPAGYGEADRTAVYHALVARAQRELAFGRTVVADATWASAAHRAAATRAAEATASSIVGLRCDCPPTERAQRVAARRRAAAGESDATPSLAREPGAADPWPGAVALDTSTGVADTVRAVQRLLEPLLHRPLGNGPSALPTRPGASSS